MNRRVMTGIHFAWVMTAVLVMAEPQRVLDFGAKGDGTSMDTAAIQQAIDVCSEQGGGTVYYISFDQAGNEGEVGALLQLENTKFVSVVHPAPFSGHLKNTIAK